MQNSEQLCSDQKLPFLSKALSYYLFGLIFFILISTTYLVVNSFIYHSKTERLNYNKKADITDIDLDSLNEVLTCNNKEVTVKKNDSLEKILLQENIIRADIEAIKKTLNATPLTLRIGQKITLEYETNISNIEENLGKEVSLLSRIKIPVTNTRTIEIRRNASDDFELIDFTPKLQKVLSQHSTIIDYNIISSLKKLGIPTKSIIELVQSYSNKVDFKRQIKSGDSITVIIEKFLDPDKKLLHYGRIVFSSLKLSNQEHNVYLYNIPNTDKFDYFSEDGKSTRQNLLKTPINAVRISSRFGRRKHPILGYTRMHRGVDFAAPINTPIYAAGNGVVLKAEWNSGYGKFVQIQHNRSVSTAYAHMHKFATNLKKGSRVKQGQIIGYVGTTGQSTGPHLHYEVRVNGKHVDPISVQTQPGVELSGEQLSSFNKFKQQIVSLQKSLTDSVELALDQFPNLGLGS